MTQNDIGKSFNFWTIIDFSNDKKKAKCQCICGKIKDVNFYNIKTGKSKSCGCKRALNRDYSKQSNNLTQQRSGKLLALEPTKEKANDGSIIWKCQCDCGNIVFIPADKFKYRKSCGCIGSPSLIGERFGKLIVLEETKDKNNNKIWKCQCDCGNITYVPTSRLRFGTTRSCGCLLQDVMKEKNKEKIKDLAGQRFGYLVVLKQSSIKKDRIYWTCQCDCGNILDIKGTNLVSGNTTSCGCRNFSKGEESILKLLSKNNISFIQHYRNTNFRYPDSNYEMEFDFFVDNKYMIEYDGKQHFEPISTWGGKNAFMRNKQKDYFKNQLCKKYNIPIIRIPYIISPEKICIEDLLPKTSKYLVDWAENTKDGIKYETTMAEYEFDEFADG